LEGARGRFPAQRIWAVFQPHTFSRTRTFLSEIANSFSAADQVLITNIFAAREVDDGSVKATDIVAISPHPAMRHIGGLVENAEYLAEMVRPGDVVIIFGAGDSYRIGELLLAQLNLGKSIEQGQASSEEQV
jgi:UDP-N-acetylmuramate--alanine ligase